MDFVKIVTFVSKNRAFMILSEPSFSFAERRGLKLWRIPEKFNATMQ